MVPAFRLGLTGGIGSGKSSVAAMLAELGAAVIDADAIARSVTAAGGSAIAAIRQFFGDNFITAAGALNRDHMRATAFTDGNVKHHLEAIIHPLVGQEIWHQAAQAQAAGHSCLVFDVPLLVESGQWRQKMSRLLVVDCTLETQIARVMARSALERAAVEAIIASQAERGHRLQAADAIIFNNDISFAVLKQQVHALAADLELSSVYYKDQNK